MTVEEIWTDFTASETADKNKPVHRTLLACMAVCNSVKADGDKPGDPTETALVNFAKNGIIPPRAIGTSAPFRLIPNGK
ncbi:MAG: hypothetical protein ACLRTQ_01270 [Candidatus Borkfalkia sp.]